MIGPRPRRPRRPPFDWSSTRAVLMIGPEPAGSERLPATHPGVSNALIRRVATTCYKIVKRACIYPGVCITSHPGLIGCRSD